MNTTHCELIDGAAVIRIDNPPVNGLSHGVRSSLVAHLLQADNDPAVRAVVIIGGDAAFSGGADITEFGTPKLLAELTLPACSRSAECAFAGAAGRGLRRP